MALDGVRKLADSSGSVNGGARVYLDLEEDACINTSVIYIHAREERTQASSTASSTGVADDVTVACRSSNAFALVVLSFFERFLKATTVLASEMDERSGGSDT